MACGGNDTGGSSTSEAGTSAQGGMVSSSGGQATAGGRPIGGQSTSAGAGGSSAGTGQVGMTEAEICTASCKQQASCNPSLDQATCETNCNRTDSVLAPDCATKQLAEFACVADLTCDELKSYGDDKLASPMCGATYQDFATACTLNKGVPPKECQDYCAKTAACNPAGRKQAGCAQTCNEVLTGFNIEGGADCSGAMQQAFACLATLDCSVLLPALAGGPTPAACSQYDTQLATACR